MSSSSSSSSSSSDSDDDESVKRRKMEKRRAKMVRRESRSKLEEIKEQKERERRSHEVKQRREYLEMKKKKEMYQRFLLEKQRNPNKEPMTLMIAKTRNDRINRISSRTAKKQPWYNMSPPRSYIEHGERQAVTPSIQDWRQMMSGKESKGGKRRNRTMKSRRVIS